MKKKKPAFLEPIVAGSSEPVAWASFLDCEQQELAVVLPAWAVPGAKSTKIAAAADPPALVPGKVLAQEVAAKSAVGWEQRFP